MALGNVSLMKIASIGGVLTVSMGFAYRLKVNDNIRRTDHYKEALKMLRSHKAAVKILGEPIKDGLIDIGDEHKNYTNKLSSRYEVPVNGSKKRGTLYFWVEREPGSEKYDIARMELQFKDDKDRRLIIKSSGKK